MTPDRVHLTFDVCRPPESIRRWWLDFPDDYRASDPDEQPYRIRTLSRKGDEVVVETHWSGPFGSTMKVVETLRSQGPHAWTADLTMMGLRIHDEFRVTPTPTGSRLEIRSTISPASLAGRVASPLVLPMLKRDMRKTWTNAARICEREAP